MKKISWGLFVAFWFGFGIWAALLGDFFHTVLGELKIIRRRGSGWSTKFTGLWMEGLMAMWIRTFGIQFK